MKFYVLRLVDWLPNAVSASANAYQKVKLTN
jgi:hypothetical protein